ncbi:MAG: hypothetical protein DI570_09175 [Phenylobacterium zucineum]|nr:MAG: hypothetical protein DI570_09175 [Phenylobacterium zucineum]
MSYSFAVVAFTKAEAKRKVEAKFDEVLASQPVHAADLPAARAAVAALIDVLNEPGDFQQINVSVSGYVSWRAEGEFTGANLSVNAAVNAATGT